MSVAITNRVEVLILGSRKTPPHEPSQLTSPRRQLRITTRMAPEALVDTAGASLDIHITMSASAAVTATKKTINLLRGWPSPALLPAGLLSGAAQRLLADPAVYVPALQYGPDAGYQPLREGLARWLGRHYGVTPDAGRICITGGASQSVACVLQSFTDPVATRAVWVVAPCYHLMCPILEDAGFAGRLRATPEDDEGMDLDALERKIRDLEEREKDLPPTEVRNLLCQARNISQISSILTATIYLVLQGGQTREEALPARHLRRRNLLQPLRQDHVSPSSRGPCPSGPQVRRSHHQRRRL